MKSRNSIIGTGTKSGTGVGASAADGRAAISNDGAEVDATIDTKQRTTEKEGRIVTDQPADDHELPGDLSEDFSEEELRDFLAADFLDVQADPSFREGLRRKLWTLVSDRYGRGPERKN